MWPFPCSPPRCPQERSSSESAAAEMEAHVHGSLAVSPVQFEKLIQCSPLVTFQSSGWKCSVTKVQSDYL